MARHVATTKAIILAGGEGVRLRPLTLERPKPMVPIANEPLLVHTIRWLRQHGVTDLFITVCYLADEIRSVLGNGREYGVNIRYLVESKPLGTAGAARLLAADLGQQPFLVVSGDALTDADLTSFLAHHHQTQPAATMLLTQRAVPVDFGVVVTKPNGEVDWFLEKPAWSEVPTDLVNTGVYVVDPSVLSEINPDEPTDWAKDVFPGLLRAGRPIQSVVNDRYWTDIGTLEDYRRAQFDVLEGRIELAQSALSMTVPDGVEIIHPVQIGRYAKIKAGARIGPYAILGDHTTVETGAVVERSIVWDAAYIGASARVLGATVASRVVAKRGVTVLEDAVIGCRTLLDAGSTVRPRVKVWPDKIIERGATVNMSMVWGDTWRATLFRSLGVGGISNVEITPEFATRLGAAYGSSLPPGSVIVTSRDHSRSSRMVKRALIAAFLSSGCQVVDLRNAATPIVRHYLKGNRAAGAVHVRKWPDNRRMTLIEFLRPDGSALDRDHERKIESTFHREEFRRVDSDDIGTLSYAGRAVDEYLSDFESQLPPPEGLRTSVQFVCDYGYSTLAPILPTILDRYGAETVSLNAFADARRSPRTQGEIEDHLQDLSNMVRALGSQAGILFREEGERLTVVTAEGTLSGIELSAILLHLYGYVRPQATLALSERIPGRVASWLAEHGARVQPVRASVRALLAAGTDVRFDTVADGDGGFIFPRFHAGFDALFASAVLAIGLRETGESLRALREKLPTFGSAFRAILLPAHSKGGLLRAIQERWKCDRATEVAGMSLKYADAVLRVEVDPVEPMLTVIAEADSDEAAERAITGWEDEVEALAAESDRD